MPYKHLSVAQLDRLAWQAGREVDPDAWAGNVRDTHRVLKVVQTLWVFLEQFNEPLLRVGVEIVTANHARQELLRWKEATWYVDETKRDYLKDLVQDKLAYVLEAKILGLAAMADIILNTDQIGDFEMPDGNRKEQRAQRPEHAQLQGNSAAVSPPSQKLPLMESRNGETGGTGGSDGSVPKAKFDEAQAELLAKRMELENLRQEANKLREKAEASEIAISTERARAEAAAAAASAAAAEASKAKAAASKAAAEQEKAKDQLSNMVASAAAAAEKAARQPKEDKLPIRQQSEEPVKLAKLVEVKTVKVDAAVQVDTIPQAEPVIPKAVDGPCPRCKEVMERAEAREAELQKQLKQQALAVEELTAKLKDMLAGAEATGSGDEVREMLAKAGLTYVLKIGSVWDRLYKDAEKRIRRFRQMSPAAEDGKAEQPKTLRVNESEVGNSQMPRWTVGEDWGWAAEDRQASGPSYTVGPGPGQFPSQTVGPTGDLQGPRAERGWAPGLAAHREEPWAGSRWKEPLREELRPRWGQEELREAEEQLHSYLLNSSGGEAACITGHRQPRHRRGRHAHSEERSVQDQLQSSDLWQRLREQQDVEQQKQAVTATSALPRRQDVAASRTVGGAAASQGLMPTLTESHSLPSLRTKAQASQQQDALHAAAAAAGFRNFRPASLRQRRTHSQDPWR
mmetsp:Transcript_20359/g.36392  ORF Transcript_20359/g.36392 Transcript_20359/m.36392 type:complete len:683 (-) Transcript_20359:56-2104(-)